MLVTTPVFSNKPESESLFESSLACRRLRSIIAFILRREVYCRSTLYSWPEVSLFFDSSDFSFLITI